MYFKSIFFKSYEYLPNDLYALYGDDGILWTMDSIRSYLNQPITVNNWKSGGQFSQRGYRNDINTGAKFSAHRFGRACDFDIAGYSAEDFRNMVKEGKLVDVLKYVTRMEEGVNWIHLDCMGLPRENGKPIEFFHA